MIFDVPNTNINENEVYSASITREQFLFYEMRVTAKLLSEGLSEKEIIYRIFDENLFQYPTEKSVQRMARVCVKRLKLLSDETLVNAIATLPADDARQICLYAMMKQYRLICDFMVTVIGEKYRIKEMTYSKIDINSFFIRLQEQNDTVASWSDSTIAKVKQVINKLLVDNEYIDKSTSEQLYPVWITPTLENAIRNNNDEHMLPALNCFS